jgi:hypothetical protein
MAPTQTEEADGRHKADIVLMEGMAMLFFCLPDKGMTFKGEGLFLVSQDAWWVGSNLLLFLVSLV